jgi:peptidoglycan/LPS O-acetylase OafA/YrhL
MMLGVLIFCLLEELNRLKFRKLPALLLGEGLLIYTVISTWSTDSSTGYGKETVVLAFLGGIVLLLCHGDIRLPAPARGLIKYACDLSFVMYIWQKGAATIVDILIPEGSDHKKVIIYCAITVAVSVIMKFLTEQLTALMEKAAPGKYFFEK